jgi:hypothetical protein
MSIFAFLFPRRPPIFYLLQFIQFFSALPSWLYPIKVFTLVAAFSSVFGIIVTLLQWDFATPYEYVPP